MDIMAGGRCRDLRLRGEKVLGVEPLADFNPNWGVGIREMKSNEMDEMSERRRLGRRKGRPQLR